MTLDELFEIWKTSTSKGILCVNGGIEGGPGFLDFGSCKSLNHRNVRYGCEHCPAHCTEFKMNSEDKLHDIFMSLYENHASYYNETYNIESIDKPINDFIIEEIDTSHVEIHMPHCIM